MPLNFDYKTIPIEEKLHKKLKKTAKDFNMPLYLLVNTVLAEVIDDVKLVEKKRER